MSDIVAKVYRGEREEAVHYGTIVVVDKDGNLTHCVGDPNFFVFTRSSAKPFQIIPLVESGNWRSFAARMPGRMSIGKLCRPILRRPEIASKI